MDASLGKVQRFPEPPVRQVYKLISPSLGRPQLVEPAPIRDAAADHLGELEVRETVQAYMQMLAESAETRRMRSCARNLLNVVQRECASLHELIKRSREVSPPAPQNAGLENRSEGSKAA